ncbi:MAG: hypothetical protein V1875_09915 [Candidatus Altiarchaeota archaeon]
MDGFEFDDEAWRRRQTEEFEGVAVNFISAEDLAASKLAIKGSESDEIGSMSVILSQTHLGRFDYEYFKRRVTQHDLREKLESVIEDLESLKAKGHLKRDIDAVKQHLLGILKA